MSRKDRIAYAKQCKQDFFNEIERSHVRAKLDKIGPFRDFLIKSAAPEDLSHALDDWTEDLTGDRTFFWSNHMNAPKPKILLKHERK